MAYRPHTRQMYPNSPIFFYPKGYENDRWVFIDDNLIPGVHPYYVLSDSGHVYNTRLEKFMSESYIGGSDRNRQYLGTIISGTFGSKTIAIHKLVAKAFVYNDDPVNKTFVCFKDGNVNNVKYDNLVWLNGIEARVLAYKNNLYDPRIMSSTITYEKVNEIKNLLMMKKYTSKEVAKMCNVSLSIVSHIRSGETWNDDYYPGKY